MCDNVLYHIYGENRLIGFRIVNLVLPGEPRRFDVTTGTGVWSFERDSRYDQNVAAIRQGQCAETYFTSHPAAISNGSASVDAAFDEMIPLVLGASYLTGLSVTSKRSLPGSDVMLMQNGPHWPRERAMGDGNAIVKSEAEFVTKIEQFIAAWNTVGAQEKALLLLHHWLDSMACWSFEDLYLSTTTLLQIIVETEKTVQARDMSYFQGVTDAAGRAGIRVLSRDFKDMRNVLIHEGRLIGGSFSGTTLEDCADVAADVLNWFDEYIHAVIGLGSIVHPRFSRRDFLGLNAYSI